MGTSASSDTPFDGKLQLVDNQVDAKSGTVRARAVFDNKDGHLMPGQFARIRMGQASKASALLINERAVGTDQNKKFVMVVGADNKAAYREVTLGASVNGLRVSKSRLAANERIVVNGLQRIRPGALVAPQVVEMTAKAELSNADKAIKVAQNHAAVISEFVKDGWQAHDRNHPAVAETKEATAAPGACCAKGKAGTCCARQAAK